MLVIITVVLSCGGVFLWNESTFFLNVIEVMSIA